MAVLTIPHNPELTKEQVRAAFEKHFAGKYKIENTSQVLRDFQVFKNVFIAVSVRLEQTGDETKFVYGAFTPRLWARLLFFVVIIAFFLSTGLTKEVEDFIKTAPEFQKTVLAAAA